MAKPLLLKIFVLDASITQPKVHPDNLKEGKGGYFVCLEVVDFSDKVPSPELKFRTKVVTSYTAGWKQSCAISVEQDKLSSYKALKVSLWKGIPAKSSKQIVTSCIGNCPDILLTSIPEADKIEQRFNILNAGEVQGTLKLVVAWYGRTKPDAPAVPTSASPLTRIESRKATVPDPEKARQSAIAAICKSKEVEIQQLQRDLQDIQQQVADEILKKQKMEKLLLRYRDVDEEARELVGGGVDWSQLKDQDRFEGRLKSVGQRVDVVKHDTPQTWADFILAHDDLRNIEQIQAKLTTSDSKWMKDFIDAEAVQNIYTQLYLLEAKRLNATLTTRQTQLASLLIQMMNSASSIELILKNHREIMLEIISIVLASPNQSMKVKLFYLFAGLSIYGRGANKLIQEGCNNFEIKDQEKKSSTQPYHLLCRTVRIETDSELLTAAVALINGMVAGEKILSERIRIRGIFTNYLAKTFAKQRLAFQSCGPLLKQLDALADMDERDNKELTELRFIGKFNLQDPRALFTQVAGQAESLGVYDIFFRHMQQLMLIPHLSGNPHTLWKFVEHTSRAITSARTSNWLLTSGIHFYYAEQYRLMNQHKMKETLETIAQQENGTAETAPTPEPVQNSDYGIHGIKVDRPKKPGKAAPSKPEVAPPKIPPPSKITGPPRAPPSRGGPPPPPPFRGTGPPPPKAAPAAVAPKPEEPVKETGLDDLNKMFEELQTDFFTDGPSFTPSEPGKKKKKIQLLPLHTSNQISILRKQFKVTDYELIRSIFEVEKNENSLQAHHYEALLQCLPTDAQMEPLLKYRGSITDLDTAEQFVVQLWEIPNIREKLKTLIFWDTFEVQLATIEGAFGTVINACHEIYSSTKLRTLFGLILSMGNFLNSGTHRTNYRSFDFKTLKKVNDVRATGKSSYTLNNYLVEFCLSNPKFSDALEFTSELPSLPEAKKLTVKNLMDELALLEAGVEEVSTQLGNPQDLEGDYYQYFEAITNFHVFAKQEVERVRELVTQFDDASSLLLKTFGTGSQVTLEELLEEASIFSDHITRIVKQVTFEKAEAEQEKSISNRRAAAKKKWNEENDWQEEGSQEEAQTPTEVKGIMDKLISAVSDGEFRF